MDTVRPREFVQTLTHRDTHIEFTHRAGYRPPAGTRPTLSNTHRQSTTTAMTTRRYHVAPTTSARNFSDSICPPQYKSLTLCTPRELPGSRSITSASPVNTLTTAFKLFLAQQMLTLHLPLTASTAAGTPACGLDHSILKRYGSPADPAGKREFYWHALQAPDRPWIRLPAGTRPTTLFTTATAAGSLCKPRSHQTTGRLATH